MSGEALARLDELAAMHDDWDGEGALAPTAAALAAARQVLERLEGMAIRPIRPVPSSPEPHRVAPGPCGEVVLEWEIGGIYLECECAEDGRIEWMHEIGGHTTHWEWPRREEV